MHGDGTGAGGRGAVGAGAGAGRGRGEEASAGVKRRPLRLWSGGGVTMYKEALYIAVILLLRRSFAA